nr:MAG TPA: HNH endonuclease [Caudoviricetes sp.]
MCDTEFKHKTRGNAYCSSPCRNRRSKVLAGKITFGPDLPPGHHMCRKCVRLLPESMFGVIESDKRLADFPSRRRQKQCRDCSRVESKTRDRASRGHPLVGPLPYSGKPIGATYVTSKGYVMEKVGYGKDAHHRATKEGWVFQHILVAEEKFNIPITRDFTIHHRNGNRADNSPINLELRVGNHGKGADVGPALLAVEEVRQSIVDHLVEMGYSIIPPGGRRNK